MADAGRGETQMNGRRKALFYVLAYLIISAAWIIFSGGVLDLLVGDAAIRGKLEILKGLFYVGAMSIGLYLLLRSWRPDADGSFAMPGDHYASKASWRLSIVYLLVMVVAIACGGYVAFENVKRSESRKIEQSLAAIATLKAAQIDSWLKQSVNYAHVSGNGSHLASRFDDWFRSGWRKGAAEQWLRTRLAALRQGFSYGDLALLDRDGVVRMSTGAEAPEAAHLRAEIQQAIGLKKPVVGKMHWHEQPDGTRHTRLHVIAPLIPDGAGGQISGLVLLEMNPDLNLFPLIQSWPTDSASAEMVLFRREGDELLFFGELRYRKGEAMKTFSIAQNPQMLAVKALSGELGIVRGKDYRDVLVIGHAIGIPGTDWIMVAKIDQDEVFRPLDQAASDITMTALLLLMVGALSLYFWWWQKRAQYQAAYLQAELRQQALVKHYDYLSKFANDIILLMDGNGVIVEANDRAEIAYGYPREKLIGCHVRSLRVKDEWADLDEQWQQMALHGALIFEGHHVRSDGSVFPVEVSTRSISTEKGMFVQSIIRDISERKRADDALRDSEARLSMLFDNMTNGLAVHEVIRNEDGKVIDYRYLDVNPAFEKMTGLHKEQIIGRRVTEVFPGGESYWIENFGKVATDGVPAYLENRTPQLGRWYSVYAYRPGPEQFAAVIQDITERKHIEMREQRLKNTLRAQGEMNGAIMRLSDQSALFPLVCRIAVEFGGMALAWVGVPDESGERIVPLAKDGKASDYLDEIIILTKPIAAEGKGPVGVTYRESRIVVINDFQQAESVAPWREKAIKHGLKSIATFPIIRASSVCAVLAVYSDEAGAFDGEIVNLLDDMVKGISFALDNFDRETSRRQAEEELRLAAKVFENSHSGIMITDVSPTIVAVNPAFSLMTGYAAEEAVGRNPRFLHSGRQESDFYQMFWSSLVQNGRWQGELWNRRKNGDEYAIWFSVSALRDEKGIAQYYIGIADDITESKENQSRIEFLAYHDALTGLPNRMLANDRLEQAIAHAHCTRTRVAVMFLDLDDFKTINDTLGHSAGDMMLKEVATRLRQSVRDSDTVSRQGGDEFLVMLTDVGDLDAINNAAIEILTQICKPFRIEGHELSTSTSIGIAIYPEDGHDCDALLKNADMAMYNAKQSGRNTHRFFAEDMNDYVLEHLLIRNGLMRALENGEFRLHYQPQLELATGRMVGAEALIRWQHPELGMVPPNRFIQVAEESGMIIQIGSWVLQEACRQAKAWQVAGWPGLVVGVNISAIQFRRGDLEQIVLMALADSGLAPQFLELELTESILIQDVDKSLDMIRRLKNLGVRLSIDDFGIGYSSLAYLRQLPVDKLKIDQSFVREIMSRKDDAAIALSIITLAHTLQKRVIAEGVETAEQFGFMREHQCDEIQGYLFSRPLNQDAFMDFLQQGVRPEFLP
ncbi:MAG: diguanylate cyclase/phosphodiesterase with and sensor(s) [Burkholderiaceae bacterium]|nr:diguanylate cyclase/phosphodiesterase with and sensor(s) [Burkholderiaceae bacterium]